MRFLAPAAVRHQQSSPLISAQETMQSDVKKPENPGLASGDRLHFPGSQITEPEASHLEDYYQMPKRWQRCFVIICTRRVPESQYPGTGIRSNVFSRCTHRQWFRLMSQPTTKRTNLAGQEHAATETSRPLSPGPDPCGRLQSLGAARPLLRLSLGLLPTVLGHTYIHRLQSEGLIGTRFAMAFMCSLSSANTSELSSS